MSALDSLIGLLELRKADSLVLKAGEQPSLLGGSGGALTMPPLDQATMNSFLEELLSPEQRAAVAAGENVEAEHRTSRAGSVVVKARLDGGKLKLVIRRGSARGVASRPTPAPPAPVPTRPLAAPEPPPPARAEARPAEPRTASLPAGNGLALIAIALENAIAQRASDLIVSSGRTPVMKLRGETVPLSGPVLDDDELRSAFADVLGEDRERRLAEAGSVDFGLDYTPGDRDRPLRLRGNLFRRHGGLTVVLRPVWDEVPSLEALGLPRTLRRLLDTPHGLVLFAGPTGSGKSTTLAALLEIVNQTRACHVLTLEDPIEYVFQPGRATVHQRQIGSHVRSFADGLRAALRESPDIILVGEMRDPETIALALTAAETGHLVLSTLHAGTASGAVERIINALPEVERSAMRSQLAMVLRNVVVQRLLPGVDGRLVAAVGVLGVNHGVAALIREGRTQLLATQMEIAAEEGMVTLEAALAGLVRDGRITRETALAATQHREALEALLADRLPRGGR